MRRLRDRDELRAAMAVIDRQFPAVRDEEYRLAGPMENFERDRPLMLCLEVDGEIRGAVIAYGSSQVTVRALAMDGELRGAGFGRRLLEAVEVEALLRGASQIVLGAVEDARGFYDRMGYRGKHTMRMKELPLPGGVRTRRAQAMADELGDLDRGLLIGRV
jgi:GNAT superfamily N-acetyltransferase